MSMSTIQNRHIIYMSSHKRFRCLCITMSKRYSVNISQMPWWWHGKSMAQGLVLYLDMSFRVSTTNSAWMYNLDTDNKESHFPTSWSHNIVDYQNCLGHILSQCSPVQLYGALCQLTAASQCSWSLHKALWSTCALQWDDGRAKTGTMEPCMWFMLWNRWKQNL